MSSVHERVFIDAPFVQAVGAFERRLGFAKGSDDGRCTLTLVAPISDKRELARDVAATATRVAAPSNFTATYRIGWPPGAAARGIPTPGFEGTITLRSGETYEECELRLDGAYDPPEGLVGVMFDTIIGQRLAHATLGALLEGMRADLRADHERTEAQKVAD
jgi:hypothetical protein